MTRPGEIQITTFPYDARWGGGYGWMIKRAGERTAIDTSEKASMTPERAVAAAQRYMKRKGIS